MKIFFMSDIHGSVHYLESALHAYEREPANSMVILGDELYHGARNPLTEEYGPKKVTELLNEHASEIIAVRGN
ncbi:MAG TPA: phosphodiesterase, partial [Ruminococcaceae bacterium]|nr:phosphodiesterase [Oscillospiraceae bacterium]